MTSKTSWILASNNKKKAAELAAILTSFDVALRSLREAGVDSDVEEWGTTYTQNAVLKAVSFAVMTGSVALADDSGLSVDALDGGPGVHSARFAGEPCDDDANNRKLIASLAALPDAPRTCRYHCIIAVAAADASTDSSVARLREAMPPLALSDFDALDGPGAFALPAALVARLAGEAVPMNVWLFEGTMEGEVATRARGDAGFGYDPWITVDDGRHVAELPDDEKNTRSHRAEALRQLAAALQP